MSNTRKRYVQIDTNNWRNTPSNEAYHLILNHYKQFGISRIANITHLDVLGIPVYIGLRPGGKTLSLSAGKGLNHIDSIVSAAMESIETHAAENTAPEDYYRCCYDNLPSNDKLPLETIPTYLHGHFTSKTVISWLKVRGLNTGREFFYPARLVTLDTATVADEIGLFSMNSNGLASGLNSDDAILAGLYEVIERDAIACWQYFHHLNGFPFSSLIEETIPFSSTRSLIERIKSCSMDLVITPLFSDIDIPIYQCLLLNSFDPANAVSIGFGCHHSDEIAMNRAITEAAQARAVYISGSRDDIIRHALQSSEGFKIDDFKEKFLPVHFKETPCSLSNVRELLDDIITTLSRLELHEPLVYSFKNTDPFSVVRIIMPSLAPYTGSHSHAKTYSRHSRILSFKPKHTGISALFL